MSSKVKTDEVLFISGIMALFFLSASIHSTIGVMLSSYIETYSLKSAQQGLFGTAESVGIITSMFLIAALLRKMPKTRLLLVMTFILAMILPGIGTKPSSYWVLLLFYALFGLSYGVVDSIASSLMSDLFPGSSAGKMSYMRAVYCLGGMVTPIVLNTMLSKGLVWNKVALIVGIPGIVIFLYFLFIAYPRLPKAQSSQQRDKITLASFISFIRLPGVLRAIIFGMVYYGHQIGLTLWIVRYLTVYVGEIKWGQYGLTMYWIGALVSRVILPQFVKNHRKLMFFGNLISAFCMGLGIISGNGKLLCVMTLLSGLAEGMTIPMLVDYFCSLDREKSALACSVVCFFNNIGSLFIPSLIGALIAASGAEVGIFILPVSSVICAVLAFGMKAKEI